MPKPNDMKYRKLYATIASHLSKNLVEDDFMRLKDYLLATGELEDKRAAEKATTVFKLMDLLKRDKKIIVGEPGGYRTLIDALVANNFEELADEVKERESEVLGLDAGDDTESAMTGTPAAAAGKPTGEGAQAQAQATATVNQSGANVSGKNYGVLNITGGTVNIS